MSAVCDECGLMTGMWHLEGGLWVHDDCDPNWDDTRGRR